jgi:hypothetical protein
MSLVLHIQQNLSGGARKVEGENRKKASFLKKNCHQVTRTAQFKFNAQNALLGSYDIQGANSMLLAARVLS